MTLAMAQATAAGDLRGVADFIRACEAKGDLKVSDMRLVCNHILVCADEYARNSGESQREVKELERMADL